MTVMSKLQGRHAGASPDEQAQMAADARGAVWTDRAFNTNPLLNIHPNDLFVRVFPDGQYDMAWAGIQKIDPVADVNVCKMEIPNPYWTNRMKLPTIQQNNPAAWSVGAGPALIEAQEQQYALDSSPNPGILRTLLLRLKGG